MNRNVGHLKHCPDQKGMKRLAHWHVSPESSVQSFVLLVLLGTNLLLRFRRSSVIPQIKHSPRYRFPFVSFRFESNRAKPRSHRELQGRSSRKQSHHSTRETIHQHGNRFLRGLAFRGNSGEGARGFGDPALDG